MIFEQTDVAPPEGSLAAKPSVWINVSQGKLIPTGRLLDCAIDGTGFFQVKRGEKTFLTRCGRFVLDAEGRISLPRSHGPACPVEAEITVPKDADQLRIERTGEVTAAVAKGPVQSLGRISLFGVLDPAALEPAGDNLFAVSTASGPARLLGQAESGSIIQGQIEDSNVDPAAERRKLEALTGPGASR
jgi:flagellar basal-body rod protein FlgG